MSATIELSKKALLTLAKKLEIVGRHDMSKEQLAEALQARGVDVYAGEEAPAAHAAVVISEEKPDGEPVITIAEVEVSEAEKVAAKAAVAPAQTTSNASLAPENLARVAELDALIAAKAAELKALRAERRDLKWRKSKSGNGRHIGQFSDQLVARICRKANELREAGKSWADIATKLADSGMNYRQIYYAARGYSWKEVTTPIVEEFKK